MTRRFALRALAMCAVLLAAIPMFAGAPSSRSMTMYFYNPFVDQMTGTLGCPSPTAFQTAGFCADFSNELGMRGTMATYPSLTGSPNWAQPNISLDFSKFADGGDCNPATGQCVSVQLNKNLSTLSADTRGSKDSSTGGQRYFAMTFTPCPVGSCPFGPGPATPFGTLTTNMPGLLSIFLSTPFTNMQICSNSSCPESEAGTARFWFDDPGGNSNLQWRIDWPYMRVLRVSANTWYAVASSCDGSQVATLYRLSNNHKNVTLSRQGSYLMPFMISGVQ